MDARRWPITHLCPATAAAFAAVHGLVGRYTVTAMETAIALRGAELTEDALRGARPGRSGGEFKAVRAIGRRPGWRRPCRGRGET